MDYIYLFNNDINSIEKIKNERIIAKLYFLKYRLLSQKEIDNSNIDVQQYFRKYSLDDIKKNICEKTLYIR